MILGVLVAIAVAVGGLSYKAARDAQKAAKKAAEAMAGVLVNKESNVQAIPVIYGERRVGGTRVFVHTEGGDKNDYLYICLVLCEGEIESITDIEIDDRSISDDRYFGLVSYQTFTGTNSQSASSLLSATSKWGSSHTLNGIAYIAVRLKWDQDAFSGIPDITAVVKGRRVYDPRTNTTAWSDNPALCIRDYLTQSRYGKGLSSSEINDTAFEQAADDIEDFTVTEYSGGPSSQQLFKCNAVIDTDDPIFQNLEKMLLGCKGFLPYQDGKYALYIDQSASSVMTLTENEILDGLSIQSERKEDKFNRVVCKFPNPATKWEPDQAIWPDANSSEELSFLSADDNEVLIDEVDLETVTSYYAARDFARIFCLRSRNALRVAFTATSEAINLRVGDVVSVTHSTPGWSAKPFQVESLTLKYDGTVDLQCVEYDSTIYAYDSASEETTYPDTDLPDPFDVDAPGTFTATPGAEILPDGSINSFVDLSWTASDDAFVSYYEVSVFGNELTFSDQTFYEETEEASIRINGLTSGVAYIAKIKAVNTLGVRSGTVSAEFTAVGDTVAPGNPTSVTAQGGMRKVDIFWTNPVDKDLAYVEIKRATNSTEANAISIGRSAGTSYTDPRPAGVANYWYWVRAVDTSGNKSVSSDTAGWVEASDNPATTVQLASDDFADGIVEVDYLSGDIVDNQYSVAMIANPDDATQIEAHGFGLIGEYDPDDSSTFTSQFIVNANKFAIGTPQVGGTTSFIPFVVYTTATSVTMPDGTSRTLDPGVYMSFASIGELVANQITAGYFNLANADGMHIRQGKTSPSTAGNGFWIGNEADGVGGQDAKFYIGTTSNYMYFDASNATPFRASGIEILDSDSNIILASGGVRTAIGNNYAHNSHFNLGSEGWTTNGTIGSTVVFGYDSTVGKYYVDVDPGYYVQTALTFPIDEDEPQYLFGDVYGEDGYFALVQIDASSGILGSFLTGSMTSPAFDNTRQYLIGAITPDADYVRAHLRIGTVSAGSTTTRFYSVGVSPSPPVLDAKIASTYIRNLSVGTLQIAGSAVTVPDGTSQSISKSLTTSYQKMGELTVDYDSADHTPEGLIVVCGLQVPGDGSTDQGIQIEIRRVYSNNTYTGEHVTQSVKSDFGSTITMGAHFLVAQVGTATSVTLELHARLGSEGGTRSANRFFIASIASKR